MAEELTAQALQLQNAVTFFKVVDETEQEDTNRPYQTRKATQAKSAKQGRSRKKENRKVEESLVEEPEGSNKCTLDLSQIEDAEDNLDEEFEQF